MYKHDPTGTSVCVHAVAVANAYRRKGVARKLLKEYVSRCQDDPAVGGTRVDRISLICHQDLIALYSSVGFTLAGKSRVVHGPNEWFEMRMEIRPSAYQDPPAAPDAVHPDDLRAELGACDEALGAGKSGKRAYEEEVRADAAVDGASGLVDKI